MTLLAKKQSECGLVRLDGIFWCENLTTIGRDQLCKAMKHWHLENGFQGWS